MLPTSIMHYDGLYIIILYVIIVCVSKNSIRNKFKKHYFWNTIILIPKPLYSLIVCICQKPGPEP